MVYTDEFDRTWRFHVSPEGTIIRGRAYRLPDSGDEWRWYWESDPLVAFYDEGFRGIRECTDNEDTRRAILAHRAEREGRRGATGALDRVAKRIEGTPDAAFFVVHLDRGTDLYVLSCTGDPDHEWRDEIEAVWNGDIWRIECEEYQPGMGPGGSNWVPADEVPEQFYGQAKADEGLKREFPLDTFPADLMVVSDQ